MQVLKVDQVAKSFGGLKAVSNLSFEVNDGEIIGLIGPKPLKTWRWSSLSSIILEITSGIRRQGTKELARMIDIPDRG